MEIIHSFGREKIQRSKSFDIQIEGEKVNTKYLPLNVFKLFLN
jgi:hypothetical protein